MKRFLLFAAAVLCTHLGLAAEPWESELTKTPGTFAPLRPLKAKYRFGWSMFTAAESDFTYTRQGGEGTMTVNVRTIGAVRGLWRMDATHIAKLMVSPLRPLSVVHTAVWKDGPDETRLVFTPSEVSRRREQKSSNEKVKTKRFTLPGIMDLHTALQFVRSQPLKDGEVYKLGVYPLTSPYLAQVQVLKRESLKLGEKTYPAIKLDVKLWRINNERKLEAHQKFKKASAWVADDENRMLLKVESELFIGSVWTELESVEWQ